MLALIPLPYRILAGILSVVAALGFAYHRGAAGVRAEWEAAKLRQTVAVESTKAKQANAAVRVVTRYVDRVRTVREAAQTIIKEIPVYVTEASDSACVVPRGFVRLHNAAAAGDRLPEPAGSPDAAPSGVALSAVAETVAGNYGSCRETAEQLIALQAWARGVSTP